MGSVGIVVFHGRLIWDPSLCMSAHTLADASDVARLYVHIIVVCRAKLSVMIDGEPALSGSFLIKNMLVL